MTRSGGPLTTKPKHRSSAGRGSNTNPAKQPTYKRVLRFAGRVAATVAQGTMDHFVDTRLLGRTAEASGYTLGGCIGGNAFSPIGEMSGTLCYVAVPNGDHGLEVSAGTVAVTSVGTNLTVGPTVSNAKSFKDLNGVSPYVGAAYSKRWVGVSVTGAYNPENGIWQITPSYSPGLGEGFGLPVAVYGGAGQTWTFESLRP